jgi:hypothetical protein
MRRWCFLGTTTRADTVSRVAEEKAYNPRLQVNPAEEYVALMNGLNLSNPKMMGVAVPANIHQGLASRGRRSPRLGILGTGDAGSGRPT